MRHRVLLTRQGVRRSIDGSSIGDNRDELCIEIRREKVYLRPVVGSLPHQIADYDAVVRVSVRIQHLHEAGDVRKLEIERGIVARQLIRCDESRAFRRSKRYRTDIEKDQRAGFAGIPASSVGRA